MNRFKVTLIALISMLGISANAQDEVEGSVSADVVSRYIWRGQALSDAAVQPTASISYKGLSLSAWGSYSFLDKQAAKEFDLTLAYTIGGFNVGITDYYFSKYGCDNKYFEYSNSIDEEGMRATSHVWEANVGYDFGFASVQWFTNFSGDDGVKKNGRRAYSSYVEVAAPFKLASCDWTATVGAVPYATSFYSDATDFAITNVSLKATKDIKVTKKFSLPVFGQAIANPSTKKAYLVVGFTLQP